MALAIGSIVGTGVFCVCEVLPYLCLRVSSRHRQLEKRAKAKTTRQSTDATSIRCVPFTVALVQCCHTAVLRVIHGQRISQLGEVFCYIDFVAAVASCLYTSERCILRAASLKIRQNYQTEDLIMQVYVFGGESMNPKSVECFDPSMGEWTIASPMPHSCLWATGVATAGRIFLCGGGDGASGSVSCFDPDVGEWAAMPSMCNRRIWPTSCAMGGYLYVCGGKGEHRGSLNSVERLDLEIFQWELVDDAMSEARHGATCAVIGRYFYVCGGLNGQRSLDSVERYDPTIERWKDMPSMLNKRGWATSALSGETLYVFGGRSDADTLNSVESYDAYELDNPWQLCAPMSLCRYAAATVASANGSIYILGGRGRDSTLRDVEVFTPERRWEPAPPMSLSRAWPVCISLPRSGYNFVSE